jgi:hypothetical protein
MTISENVLNQIKGDSTHETSGKGSIGSNLIIDLDQSLSDNHRNLSPSQGILQSILQDDLSRCS